MAQSPYACLAGTAVTIDATVGPFRSCPYCAFTRAVITLAVDSPHMGELKCINCGTHTAWLGRDHMAAMLAQHRGAA